jgi:hypothetical protein
MNKQEPQDENKMYYIVNNDGEIVREYDPEHHYLRSTHQDDAYQNLKRKQTEFTLTNMDEVQEIIGQLTASECGYLLYLQTFIDFEGRLVKNTFPERKTNLTAKQEIVLMTKKDIRETLGLSRNTFNPFFNRLIELGIIEETAYHFKLNSRYHFRGKLKSQRVIKAFSVKVREVYRKNNAKDLGFIYKVLPYVHFESNTLCKDPYERDVFKVEPLTQEDVAAIVGEDVSTIRSRISRLKFDNQYVFASVYVGNKVQYMVNPFVFYRSSKTPDETLLSIFIIGNNRRKLS